MHKILHCQKGAQLTEYALLPALIALLCLAAIPTHAIAIKGGVCRLIDHLSGYCDEGPNGRCMNIDWMVIEGQLVCYDLTATQLEDAIVFQ